MTKKNWWALFDKHKDNMRALVEKYHPTSGRKHDAVVSAPGAEAVAESARNRILTEAKLLGIVRFDAAVLSRDADALVSLLNEVWFGMPESRSVREELGFFQLCDLCEPADEPDDDEGEVRS